MVTRRVFLTLLWAVAGSIAPTGAPDAAHGETADRSLLILLPSPEDVRPWVPDASAQFAEGQELFALINGGAEIFLRHGFERATTQTYSLAEGRHIQVEIYRMGTEDGATAVYLRKIGSTELRLAIGDAGVRGEYYIVFRTGRFLVTVTAGDSQADAQAAVLRVARAIERRIPATCP
jgi:hypothetical protein